MAITWVQPIEGEGTKRDGGGVVAVFSIFYVVIAIFYLYLNVISADLYCKVLALFLITFTHNSVLVV